MNNYIVLLSIILYFIILCYIILYFIIYSRVHAIEVDIDVEVENLGGGGGGNITQYTQNRITWKTLMSRAMSFWTEKRARRRRVEYSIV